LYGCEIYPLLLKEEHRLMILRRRRGIFRPRGDETREGWRNCIMGTFIIVLLLEHY
jgi:hypothetical protein